MTEMIRRSTLSEIVGLRNETMALYSNAHKALQAAGNALKAAHTAQSLAAPGATSYNQHVEEARKLFLKGFKVPDENTFLKTARSIVDADVWSSIVSMTDLETLMDKEAKDELRLQLQEEPPEITEDNVAATIEALVLDAGTIFRRGIANAFSKLDRRFRSHDGWKIGSRVILSGAFDGWGYWNHYRNLHDTLIDIERVFLKLDGKPMPATYAGIVGVIDHARKNDRVTLSPRQTECENEYFRIWIYKNGNCHVWFKRDDLVKEVNKLIGEYYENAVGKDRTDADREAGVFNDIKTTPAKHHGFFPTPEAVVDRLMRNLPVYRREGSDPLRALEPSAGYGNIASALAGHVSTYRDEGGLHEHFTFNVDVVELQPSLADKLRADNFYREVTQANFMALVPQPVYDVIMMNPPFDQERDIDHVMHAMKFLKPDGHLVAVMSAGTEFRETKKARAFRTHIANLKGEWQDLPQGAFASVGTNVNTVIVRVNADGRAIY